MSELLEGPFASYLHELDALLSGLPAAQKQEIRRELLAHLEDAAAEQGLSVADASLQSGVIQTLGSSADLGLALYEIHQGGNSMVKRLFDICFATFWLVVLSPLFLVTALLIKLDSKGPVFYHDRRMGRNGRRYSLYKFRSMRAGSEGEAVNSRVTRVGRVLRKASIDELPQLWNVLKGDMSIVGPRPANATDVNVDDPVWRRVLLARPGITGLTLVRYGFAHIGTQQRLEADLEYLEKQSLRNDLYILRRTLSGMFSHRSTNNGI